MPTFNKPFPPLQYPELGTAIGGLAQKVPETILAAQKYKAERQKGELEMKKTEAETGKLKAEADWYGRRTTSTGSRGGSPMVNLKAEIISKYLEGGWDSLDERHQLVLKNFLKDPDYNAAVSAVVKDPRFSFLSGDEIKENIEKNASIFEEASSERWSGIPTFKTEQEATDAFNKGLIKKGQEIIVGGNRAKWE